jgi:endonuclease YncB( thermonuclease family)
MYRRIRDCGIDAVSVANYATTAMPCKAAFTSQAKTSSNRCLDGRALAVRQRSRLHEEMGAGATGVRLFGFCPY